ncbi:hypothetical protein AAEU33_19850 [Chryseobacterium sp. Chry.R1]|uniref:hypothetical protein n=1 Tax=Chryseobacterium sp. Chry.R1 TaxID=3139392 RepID=UPI0031F94DDE
MVKIRVIERIWNYIHYFIYVFEVNASKVIAYPIALLFDLFYKIPFIESWLKKKNSSAQEIRSARNNAINNRIYGQNITIAGIQMGGLLVLIEYGLFNIFQATLGKPLIQYVWLGGNYYKWLFVATMLIIPYIINNQLLWKNDKYLKYFEEFDKEPKQLKRKWIWISFGIIVGIFGFFVLSFLILTNVLKK